MIQRDQGMGLAPTEVGLQLDHRIAARTRQPPSRPGQQVAQALGDVGASKERLRIPVLEFGAAIDHLFQVGRVLSLLEAACRHICMRRDDVPPRCQPRLWRSLGRLGSGTTALAAGLLVEHLPH